tara:strand:- start:4192 stop:4620 length:429 start_codon:yes stop_codon:yes gene_type:complete
MNKKKNTEFEDKILILFDGVCSLCNVLIKILDRIPNNNKIIICAMESTTGMQILKDYGLELDPDTVVVIEKNNYYTKSKAIKKIVNKFTGLSKLLTIINFFPDFVINIFYDLIAKNRYRFFKRYKSCPLNTKTNKLNLKILN